jgi:MarR family transcriptional regulator, organic hydroperoxide resistance regulator
MSRNREHFAAYIGVTDPQYIMMALIGENPDVTVGKIAERLGVSSQFVTIEIGKLIRNGIVDKRPNEADRRSVLLQLTPKARDLLRELGPLRRKINDMTFKSLDEDRARALDEILTALISDAETALHELEAPHMRGKKAPSALAEAAAARSG